MTTAVVEAPQNDELAYTKAHGELTEAQNALATQEQTLAAATAQFNEQCRLQAEGKKADPQKYRDSMAQIEQRIIGHRAIVAERKAAFDSIALRRAEAARAAQQEIDLRRLAGLQRQFDEAKGAVSNAQMALKQAILRRERAGNQLKQEIMRWDDAGKALQRAMALPT
jgi:hypothetical protein